MFHIGVAYKEFTSDVTHVYFGIYRLTTRLICMWVIQKIVITNIAEAYKMDDTNAIHSQPLFKKYLKCFL